MDLPDLHDTQAVCSLRRRGIKYNNFEDVYIDVPFCNLRQTMDQDWGTILKPHNLILTILQ